MEKIVKIEKEKLFVVRYAHTTRAPKWLMGKIVKTEKEKLLAVTHGVSHLVRRGVAYFDVTRVSHTWK